MPSCSAPLKSSLRLSPAATPRLDERRAQLVVVGAVLDVERAVGAVERAAEARVALGPVEVGQDVVEPPPGGAVGVAPLVVVAVVAADVDHRVHRRAPAEGLHAGPVGASPVEVLLRRRLVVPVPLGLEEHRERQRDVDVVVVVGRTRLEEQHADVRILGQPGGDDAAGTARSDDDVVELLVGHGLPIDGTVTRTTNLLVGMNPTQELSGPKHLGTVGLAGRHTSVELLCRMLAQELHDVRRWESGCWSPGPTRPMMTCPSESPGPMTAHPAER